MLLTRYSPSRECCLTTPSPGLSSGLLIMTLPKFARVKAKVHALSELSVSFSDFLTALFLSTFFPGAALTRKFLGGSPVSGQRTALEKSQLADRR